MKLLRYVLVALLLASGASFAQKKIPVEVAQAGDDPVSNLVAEELRAAIRATSSVLTMPDLLEAIDHSQGLRLTMELARPRIRLQLVAPRAAGVASETPIAVNIVYDSPDMPLGGAYIRSVIEMCGVDSARLCATRIVGTTQRSIEWLRQNWPSLWKTL